MLLINTVVAKKVSCVTLEHYITVDGGFSLFYLIAFCLLMYNQ